MRQLTDSLCFAGCGRGSRALTVTLLVLATALMPTRISADPPSAQLSVGTTVLSFRDADPDGTPQIAAAENPVTVHVQAKDPAYALVQLTALAAGDLISASDLIPITRISWTAQGNGFLPSGVMSRDEPQLVGQWAGKTNVVGNLQFWLENSWSYPAGDYSQTVVYTLIAY